MSNGLQRLELKNFTAFSDIAVDFSPKINVIIGENSTGKTHLLKAAYALCSAGTLSKKTPDINKDDLTAALTTKLMRLFVPLDDKLGKMHHQGASDQAYMKVQFANGQKIACTFFNNSKLLEIVSNSHDWQDSAEAAFIPTKEVLSFMKGFSSLYEKYGLSFDQTYQDICILLDLPEMRAELRHAKNKWAMDEIRSICGGHFVFYGGGKVTFKTDDSEYSANSMAEGFRKIGMLSRLLETGSIQPGVSGPLFWDEPEANLNPKLMRMLVQILLELSRNGQQIILATHNYVLLKYFDLLMDKKKDDHVQFHSLYRDASSHEIRVTTTSEYLKITPNPIDDAYGSLIDQEIKKDMGDLGK